MFARSANLVFTQIISLDEKPFSTGKKVRKSFSKIFFSEMCFSEMRENILTLERPVPHPALPFIRNIGSVCFHTRSTGPRNIHREKMAYLLTGIKNYWDPQGKISLIDEYDLVRWDEKVFGWDFLLQDQRMNFLHFETAKKNNLIAYDKGQKMAVGSVMLHLYPAGYVVIIISISLLYTSLESTERFLIALKECNPGNKGNTWIWKGMAGDNSLYSISSVLRKNIFDSILKTPNMGLKIGEWSSSIRLVTPCHPDVLGKTIIKGDYDYFDLRPTNRSGPEYILGTHQGFFYVFSEDRDPKRTHVYFWRLFKLFEYAFFKKHIYDDYRNYLSKEIVKLKEYRFNASFKLLEEPLTTFGIYDKKIGRYLHSLESHIRSVKPFYKRIYSFFAKNINLYEKRDMVNILVEQWEDEVEKWDPPLILIWKKVISPLKSLFEK